MPASPESRRHLSSAATLPCTKRLVVGPWLCTGQTNSGQRLMTGWPEWYATLLLSGGLNNGRWRQEDCSGSCWRCDWLCQGGPVGAAIGAGLAFYMAEQQEKLNANSRCGTASRLRKLFVRPRLLHVSSLVASALVGCWSGLKNRSAARPMENGSILYMFCAKAQSMPWRKSIWVKKRSARMANMPHTS